MQTIASQELRSNIKACLSSFRIRHPARTHNDAGDSFNQMGNDLESEGNGQGDFDDDDSSTRDGLGGKESVL
jgi:hypothetical protein